MWRTVRSCWDGRVGRFNEWGLELWKHFCGTHAAGAFGW